MVGPTGNETGNVISGNLVGSAVAANKIGNVGIAVFQQASATVSLNRVLGVVTTATNTTSGIRVSGTANGVSITRNQISDVKSNKGIFGFGSNGIHLTLSVTNANVTISNNFIWDVSAFGFAGVTSADNGYGIMLDTGAGYKIYDNSVFMGTNQTAAGSHTAAINIASAVTTAGGVDLRGNIFVNAETIGTRFGIYHSSTAGATVFSTINNNDYFAQNVGLLTSTAGLLWPTGKPRRVRTLPPRRRSALRFADRSTPATDQHIAGYGRFNRRELQPILTARRRPATRHRRGRNTYCGRSAIQRGHEHCRRKRWNIGNECHAYWWQRWFSGVVYNPFDGTAMSPSDYTCPSGNLIWADGDTADKTITATIIDDNVFEPSQDFTVALSAPSGGATLGANTTATNTITDNDSAPTFTIDTVTSLKVTRARLTSPSP